MRGCLLFSDGDVYCLVIGTFRDGTFSDGTFSDGTCCMRTHVTTGQPTYNKQNGG